MAEPSRWCTCSSLVPHKLGSVSVQVNREMVDVGFRLAWVEGQAQLQLSLWQSKDRGLRSLGPGLTSRHLEPTIALSYFSNTKLHCSSFPLAPATASPRPFLVPSSAYGCDVLFSPSPRNVILLITSHLRGQHLFVIHQKPWSAQARRASPALDGRPSTPGAHLTTGRPTDLDILPPPHRIPQPRPRYTRQRRHQQ